MPWPWGSSKSEDATSELDSDLREFLRDETSKRRHEQKVRDEERSRQTNEAAVRSKIAAEAAEDARHKPAPLAPPESRFHDGRYAHLWKTYQSPSALAEQTMTPQDHLTAVLGNYSDRKAAIGRAAIENCVVEQIAQRECFMYGSWEQLSTMCRAEGRAFNRCYEMQSRFLKALGYLSQPRSDEEEERIQMHADKLYHQMLEREKTAQETSLSANNIQAPLIPADEVLNALGEDSAWFRMRQQAASRDRPVQLTDFPASQQKEIVKKLQTMTDAEKAVELQLLAAERRADQNLLDNLMDVYDEEAKQRASRKEEGKPTISDRLKSAWGWDK